VWLFAEIGVEEESIKKKGGGFLKSGRGVKNAAGLSAAIG
jgi:hypothetical protein